jgi:hypothetical protein
VYVPQMLFVFLLSRLLKGPFHPGPLTDDLHKNKYHLPHIHLLPPDDGLQMGPKQVEAW